jgi:asparagine synthase (glutamine-hydrolysing)
MCGICGKFNFYGDEFIPVELIDRMCGRIVHRGPDDQGMYVQRNVGLGMRRLSIIDLEGGHQPIHNEDKSVWTVFNGEIYNFEALRLELEKQNHKFATRSDTEVIVHAYEAYGLDCFLKFRGMFAIALWDEKNARLVLARDRAGKKPLFYSVSDRSVVFGSEIKCLMEDKGIGRSVNPRALDLFLTYQYVPSPYSMFEGIQKLPPACYLVCEKGGVRMGRYWTPDDSVETGESEEDLCGRIRGLLRESVGLRMISDVPLGAFLSGGIDSSIVVALMAEQSRRPIKTFSIGFNEKEFSELKYARIAAKRFGTDHQELIVTPEVSDLIPKLVWHYNEPFGDSSAIPTYYLSQMTRQSVKVALSGDGGDELFAGYTKYPALNRIVQRPRALSLLLEGIHRGLPEGPFRFLDEGSFPNRALRSLRVRTMTLEQRNRRWDSAFGEAEKQALFSNHMIETLRRMDSVDTDGSEAVRSRSSDPISRVLFEDFVRYLPDDLLVKVDIASMAHSLEVRCPFLDSELVELAMKIPSSLKLRGGVTKYLLKKAFSNVLPEEILNREKAGFAIPLDEWLRKDLREWVREAVLDGNMAEFFNMDYLGRMLNSHLSGKSNQGGRIWSVLNFSAWHKMFIGNQSA